jgi:Fe2+ or Zn2+ uptake regulation protein
MSRHSSAQEVYRRARQRLPGLNPATVYRTLEALHRAGLLDQLGSSEAPLRFSLRDPSRPHHHLVCRSCGRSFELDPRRLRPLGDALARTEGFALDDDQQTLTGLCSDCRPTARR